MSAVSTAEGSQCKLHRGPRAIDVRRSSRPGGLERPQRAGQGGAGCGPAPTTGPAALPPRAPSRASRAGPISSPSLLSDCTVPGFVWLRRTCGRYTCCGCSLQKRCCEAEGRERRRPPAFPKAQVRAQGLALWAQAGPGPGTRPSVLAGVPPGLVWCPAPPQAQTGPSLCFPRALVSPRPAPTFKLRRSERVSPRPGPEDPVRAPSSGQEAPASPKGRPSEVSAG